MTFALSTLLCAVVGVAACSSPGSSGSGGSGSGGGADSIASKSTINLGADAPETGPSSSVFALASGADAYFKYTDAHGGINGYKFNYIIIDDQFNPALAISAARKLVQQDNVFAMVGGVGTNTQLAISKFLLQQGVPNIGPASTDPAVANQMSFMTAASATNDGAYQAQYAISKLSGGKPVGALYENDSVGQPYLAAYSEVASKSGAVLKKAAFAAGATDFTAQIDQLKSAGVGVVLVAGAASALLPAMETADSLGYTPKWVVTSYDTTPSLLKSLPARQRQNMYFSSATPLSGTAATSVIDTAVKQYESGIEPGNDTTVGWVTASIFGAAFKQMTDNGGKPTRSGLIAALDKFRDYSSEWIQDITYAAAPGVSSPHVPRPAEAMIGFKGNQLSIVSPFTQPPKLSISTGQ